MTNTEDMHIIDWILYSTSVQVSGINTSKIKNRIQRPPKEIKKEILFYCKGCNSAYELILTIYRQHKREKVLRHDDFPTFKLTRKLCLDCKPIFPFIAPTRGQGGTNNQKKG